MRKPAARTAIRKAEAVYFRVNVNTSDWQLCQTTKKAAKKAIDTSSPGYRLNVEITGDGRTVVIG